ESDPRALVRVLHGGFSRHAHELNEFLHGFSMRQPRQIEIAAAFERYGRERLEGGVGCRRADTGGQSPGISEPTSKRNLYRYTRRPMRQSEDGVECKGERRRAPCVD